MKTCLITGGGSKFGSKLTEQLVSAGYQVYLLTGSEYQSSSTVTVIPVDWKTLGLANLREIINVVPALDLVFFNHNSSALSKEKFAVKQLQSLKDWQQAYFVACQFPYYLIHALQNKITETTKVGWMLSELIKRPEDSQVGFADYIGNKFTNSCIMRAFALEHPATFFGVNPELVDIDSQTRAQDIVKLFDKNDLNSKIFYANGQEFTLLD